MWGWNKQNIEKRKNKTDMNKNEIYIYDVKPKTLKFWSLSPSLSPAYARRNFDGWNAREFVEAKQEIWCTLSPVSIDDFFFFLRKRLIWMKLVIFFFSKMKKKRLQYQ